MGSSVDDSDDVEGAARESTETTDFTFPELLAVPPGDLDVDPVARPPKRAAPPPLPPRKPEHRLVAPTVVERAIDANARVDPAVRGDQLAKAVDATSLADPAAAAIFAYELGEHQERRGEDNEALASYRRAFALDGSLLPARWALRRIFHRRAAWNELVALIDEELAHCTSDVRASLLVERTVACGHATDDPEQLAGTIAEAVRLAPRDHRALLELERIATRRGDTDALVGAWERLAEASEQPQRKIAFWLSVARAVPVDRARASAALALAARIAVGPLVERVAREALRFADEHGTPAEIAAAIATLTRVIGSRHRKERVALVRGRAQLARADGHPLDAWTELRDAFPAPDEPVILVDLIELAHDLGRHDELPGLVQAWHAATGPDPTAPAPTAVDGPGPLLALWFAEAFSPRDDLRRARRTLLAALERAAPGHLLLATIAECDALGLHGPAGVRPRELAASYARAGRAAIAGSWLGTWTEPRPALEAGVALYVQAAELLAHHVATPESVAEARELLALAIEIAPRHPAVVESWIELDDRSGQADSALARIRALAADDGAMLERGIRIAYRHGLVDQIAQLQRDLLRLRPRDCSLAWQLESTLARLQRDGERVLLLNRLAQDDPDPARRRTALLGAAAFHERAGAAGAAVELYRQQLALAPHDGFTRGLLIDLLRAQARWEELVAERLDEVSAPWCREGIVRRALREAAWVREVWLDDAAGAAAIYADWLAQIPDDRTALEGLARCRAACGDFAGEVEPRMRIAELDQTPDARWLYAQALARAGRDDEAIAHYRALLGDDERAGPPRDEERAGEERAGEESTLASASAALALADIATRKRDLTGRAFACEAFAKSCSDPQLAGALYADVGWLRALVLGDIEGARDAFAAVLERDPTCEDALLGMAIVSGRLGETARAGAAYSELASTLDMPAAAVALHLRAAALAAAAGDLAAANDRIELARSLGPDNVDALFAVAERGAMQGVDASDPFATADRLTARAELLAARGALTDDPTARTSWELDRAEALELAGQLAEAAALVEPILRRDAGNRRAWTVLRRIALAAGDSDMWARASCSIAQLSHDPAHKARMLRDAATVFDAKAPNADQAIAVYRQLVAVEPSAPEAERLLELLRKRSDSRGLLRTLTDRIGQLSEGTDQIVPLLLERSTVLGKLGRHDEALRDLSAVLEHMPNNADALRMRAEVAREAGDLDAAVALWWRFLAVVPVDSPDRAEIERLLERALASEESVARPPGLAPAPVGDGDPPREPDDATSPWGWSGTQTNTAPAGITEVIAARRATTVVLRTSKTAEQATPVPESNTVLTDLSVLQEQERAIHSVTAAKKAAEHELFGRNTVLADLSELQEQERREAGGPVAAGPGTVAAGPTVSGPGTVDEPVASDASTVNLPDGFDITTTGMTAALGAGDLTSRTGKLTPPAIDLEGLDDGVGEVDSSTTVIAIRFAEPQPLSGDDSAVVVMSYDQLQGGSDVASEDALAQCERELPLVADPGQRATLHVDAGRLAELLDQPERARTHYEAAVLANPQGTAALRGLRRLAREAGDLAEAARLVEAELAVAGPRERPMLARHRIDLLMAIGELDLARVAVGEILDRDPFDVPALLATIELAFRDQRTDELVHALETLITTVTSPDLRAALANVRAILADQRATTWEDTSPAPPSATVRLRTLRAAIANGDRAAAAQSLLELAYQAESEDPIAAAALAIRAQQWSAGTAEAAETGMAAAQLAATTAPRDPMIARIASETALATHDSTSALRELTRWARSRANPVERAYAAGRAAELDPARLDRLWAQVLELDPGDDYAFARLRNTHVAANDVGAVVELDRQLAAETRDEAAVLRAANDLIAANQLDVAIAELAAARARRASVELGLAQAEHLAAANRFAEAGALLDGLAGGAGLASGELIRMRAAFLWGRAIAAAALAGDTAAQAAAATAALRAWELVLGDDPHSSVAHAAAIEIAIQTGDRDTIATVLARAGAADRSPWSASSLELARARLYHDDPERCYAIANAPCAVDDPRRTVAALVAGAARRDATAVVEILEQRARRIAVPGEPDHEGVMLRARAGVIALDAGDAARAVALLEEVEDALVDEAGVVRDVLDVARGRAGQDMPVRPPTDSFVRALREADAALASDVPEVATRHYQRALALRPGEPLATLPLARLAIAARDAALVTTLVREQLRVADDGDPTSRSSAYELLARVHELRGDATAAHAAYVKASAAEPGRIDLVHRLERELVVNGRLRELLQLRAVEMVVIERAGGASRGERAAMLADTATLAVREGRQPAELGKLYRNILEVDPADPLALFHLESLARANPSEQLATLQERIAGCVDDARHQAAYLTRAGETLAQLGKHVEAVKRFARAVAAIPEYASAIEAWSRSALAGELWVEVARAAAHKASLPTTRRRTAAALWHFAGVALMDKADAGDPAIVAFERALEADREHVDAFLRVRILLEQKGDHVRVAKLLQARLEVEQEPSARAELHRALAEYCFGTGDDRAALRHYRKILAIDHADVRAHAAIADLASRAASREDAADAIAARLSLESDPRVLATLCERLGMLWIDHDSVQALRAFQQAAVHRPCLENFERLADSAIHSNEWPVALEACERLARLEQSKDRLATNLRRAALVFSRGYSDPKRAEQMYEAALDNAPTNTDCLELLLQFYADSGTDPTARMKQVVAAMRARIDLDPTDGAAYRMMSRALAATGRPPALRAATELAQLLGTIGDVEQRLLAELPPSGELARLAGRGHDEALFAGAVQPEIRELFRACVEPIAKFVGGVSSGRKDRLRPPHPAVAVAREVAGRFGFVDVDVYVAGRDPYGATAETTANLPIVVLGPAVAGASASDIRFAIGAAFKLNQLGLAVPARLSSDELAALGQALVASFEPGEVTAHVAKLRALLAPVPTARVHAHALAAFNHHAFTRDLKIAYLRAGWMASGSVLPAFAPWTATMPAKSIVVDPIIRRVLEFVFAEPA